MANLSDALEQVRSQARAFRAVIELADQLEGMVSVDQAINEKNNILLTVEQKLRAAEQDLKAVQMAVKSANASAQATAASAVADKEDIVGRAIAEAKAIKEKADETRKSADAYAVLAKAKTNTTLVEIEKVIADRARQLDELTAKIDRAQAKMMEMLRG